MVQYLTKPRKVYNNACEIVVSGYGDANYKAELQTIWVATTETV